MPVDLRISPSFFGVCKDLPPITSCLEQFFLFLVLSIAGFALRRDSTNRARGPQIDLGDKCSVANLIRSQQQDYYAALAASDQASDATPFVEFMLQTLHAAMSEAVVAGMPATVSGKVSWKILAAVRINPASTIPELAELTGVSTRTVERHLQKLQEQGRLRRIGPAKGGHWELG